MRILHVTTVPVTLRRFIAPIVRLLSIRGWEHDALARAASSCGQCRAVFRRVLDIDWSRNPANPANLLTAVRRIRTIVADGGYDIVHVHTPVAAFVTRFALRSRGVDRRPKVICTAHGFHFHPLGGPVKNFIYRALEKRAGRWTDALVVINRTDYDAALQHRIVPRERLFLMRGIGVDSDFFDPVRIPEQYVVGVRTELRLPPDARLFLMIAEFNPGKRHEDAVDALARLANPSIHLALAGTGRLVTRIRELAIRSGLANRIHFLGQRDDIPVLIRAADAVLLPSIREGLPRSILEAMSLARPVIGADIRGIRDLLQDGAGLLFPPRDPAALAARMREVLDDPDAARIMGEAGRRQVLERYAIHLIAAEHARLYESLVP